MYALHQVRMDDWHFSGFSIVKIKNHLEDVGFQAEPVFSCPSPGALEKMVASSL